MNDPERKRIAWHESGHASLAQVCLGLKVATVTLRPGLTRLVTTPEPPDALLYQLAGAQAEWLAIGPVKTAGFDSDRAMSEREAFTLTSDLDAMDDLIRRSKEKVQYMLLARWSSVKTIAEALIDGPGRLTGDDIAQLVNVTPLSKDFLCPV